jgi:hypothetical protein
MKYSKSNYSGVGANPTNSLSKEINRGIYKARSGMPPLELISKWRSEYNKSDLQYIMLFADFKRIKNRYRKKGKDISVEKIAEIWKKERTKN